MTDKEECDHHEQDESLGKISYLQAAITREDMFL